MEDWSVALDQGDTPVAWDLFVSRYRRLILAAIRHYAQDYDEVMDVFAWVCESLRKNDLQRLRTYQAHSPHRARFSTWLVTVVRHLTIDWIRRRDGRRRLPALAQTLPPHQQRIFERVFLEGRSHLETYELIRAREAPDMTFKEFLAELRRTYRAVSEGRRGSLLRELHPTPLGEEPDASGSVEATERRAVIQQALASLSPQDRVTVELYVVEELPATDVARIAGLSNAKAVYNRVYRALATLREYLDRAGIRDVDL